MVYYRLFECNKSIYYRELTTRQTDFRVFRQSWKGKTKERILPQIFMIFFFWHYWFHITDKTAEVSIWELSLRELPSGAPGGSCSESHERRKKNSATWYLFFTLQNLGSPRSAWSNSNKVLCVYNEFSRYKMKRGNCRSFQALFLAFSHN